MECNKLFGDNIFLLLEIIVATWCRASGSAQGQRATFNQRELLPDVTFKNFYNLNINSCFTAKTIQHMHQYSVVGPTSYL